MRPVQERMTVEMENCRVLVADQKIEQMKDIIPVLEQITRQNQSLLIVTEDITGMHCRHGVARHAAMVAACAVNLTDALLAQLHIVHLFSTSCGQMA